MEILKTVGKTKMFEFFEIQEMIESILCIETARYLCKEYYGYTTCLAKAKEDKCHEVNDTCYQNL